MNRPTLLLLSLLLAAGTAWGTENKNVLRFGPGAPQLNYLRIQPVAETPEPAAGPFHGRIAYDENHTSRVSSPIAGRVVKLAVQAGDTVKAGQPLLWLDAPDLAGAVADERKAQADLHAKELAHNRAKMLFDGQVLARKDLEGAESDYQQARAEADRASARLKNLAPAGGLSVDGRYALRSPLFGVVAERQTNPGSEVRPDNPAPLFVITDPSRLWAMIDLPERDLGKVKSGQAVSIEVDAYPGRRFSGRIAAIGATLDPATRRVAVRCTVDNPQGLLKPEMYARVSPLMDPPRLAIRVPNTAVITEGLYSFVFTETSPGTLEKRRITLAAQDREFSMVREGLKAGDRVVTTGALLLNSELSGEK